LLILCQEGRLQRREAADYGQGVITAGGLKLRGGQAKLLVGCSTLASLFQALSPAHPGMGDLKKQAACGKDLDAVRKVAVTLGGVGS
jgi:hypothetical protein